MTGRPRTPLADAEPRSSAVHTSDQRLNAGFSALRRVDREVFTVLALLCCACLGFAFATGTLGSDSWLGLVGGRVVVEHGLPHHDTLTVWSLGRRWIDQQWLAQVVMYGLFALGGLSLLVLTTLAATIASIGGLIALARRRGATATSTAIVTVALFFLVLPAADVRAQTLAYPLLAALLWLLWGAGDGRGSPTRLALTLPVLVVWANVHGSVLLGATLVIVVAVETAFARRDARVLGFVPLAAAAVFVSPYGFGLVDYYRTVLLNPAFGKLVTEWRMPTPAHQPLFFVAALMSLALVGARRRRFTPSELVVFALTVVAGLLAVRNIVWFALIGLVLVPRTFDVQSTPNRRSRLNLALLSVAVAVTGALAVSVASRVDGRLTPSYPAAALVAVERSAGARPIWADDHYADWLLFNVPSARGHVLFDARFELLTRRELTRISQFDVRGAGTVLVPRRRSKQVACIGGNVVYRNGSAVVAVISPEARTASHRNC